MEPELGLRVVRGPDWQWADQDGGEGFVGTVAGLEETEGAVIVQWDMGQRCKYRYGRDGKFDLRILDSGPIARTQKASGIACAWCQEEDVVGCVWRCTHCLDYYLCTQCYLTDRHSIRHPFFRITSSNAPQNRERMCSRHETSRVTVRGIFRGACVTRGADWTWGNQDGGVSGCVVGIKGWHNETRRSVVEVQWEGHRHKNIYRVGHGGKVDLKCLTPAEGGRYNPDHLPLLGGAVSSGSEGGDYEFAAGDTVRVDLDPQTAKLMQEGHGGWNEAMTHCIRDVGMVNSIYDNGDVQVRYHSNTVFTFNPLVLMKVDFPFHIPGTAVCVLDDISIVHELQTVGPGWNDDIALTLGVTGVLTKMSPSGEVQASVNGQRWLYHPQCLQPLPRHHPQPNPGVEDVDRMSLMKVMAILQQCDSRDGHIYVAATGDVPTLKRCLEKHPEEINRKLHGRTAVHVACSEGYIGCLKLLLTYKPDVEMTDHNGLRPIHVCAYSNFAEAARVLLEYGAEIDAKDENEHTATMAAGALGHYEVLEVLLGHHLLNLHVGDHVGSTALHCAVIARRYWAIKLLLEAGADPSIPNYTASTPLHDAAGAGDLVSVERMVMYFPQHINLEKCDDGTTPLHVSVSQKRLDVAYFLLAQPSCRMDHKSSNNNCTPLHLAVNEGHTAMVELLVGYGADMNATMENGNTPLMLVVAQSRMKPLDRDTPHLNHIEETLLTQVGSGFTFDPYIVVACMMAQEGADPHIKNSISESPLQKCPPDIAAIVKMFAQKHGDYHGCLRSKTSLLPATLKRRKVVPPPAEASGVSSQQTSSSFPKHLKEEEVKPDVTAPSTSTTTDSRTPDSRTSESRPASSGKPESRTSDDGTPKNRTTESSTTDIRTLGIRTSDSRTEELIPITITEGEEVTQGSGDLSTTPAPQASRQDSDDQLCCLCGKEMNVELDPCGHSVLCSNCAREAKRCPICNIRIVKKQVTTKS